jgi:cytosine/adenosine deaminase-related metal-dependent hydrolase
MRTIRRLALPALALAVATTPANAQSRNRAAAPPARDTIVTRTYGDLAAGPYKRLVIRNAMVIPGHGGPPAGPYDIVIEGNTITEMIPFDPVAAERRGSGERPTGDRVIDATGKYVMPGMIDLHAHIRTQPMELEYVYYLKLAHGTTTMVNASDRSADSSFAQARLSARNEILAPRMFPLVGWGTFTKFTRVQLDDPANTPEVARQMAAAGVRVISMDANGWSRDLIRAIAAAAKANGMITSFHIPPSTIAVANAVDAACLGITMIEHHYGYAESALPRRTQDFPPDYAFGDELARFRSAGKVWTETDRDLLLGPVVDSLVRCGVTMIPTRVVYEANRDVIRAISLPWHARYTHQALMDWNYPNPAYHGSYHYDWTSDDEANWNQAYELWGKVIFEFNRRGGRVAFATDDNYIWATPGFGTVRELQLLRETGMHALEAIRAATRNSAEVLGEKSLGLVRPGFKADLVIVDGNPVANLKFLYSFGDLTLDRDGRMVRTKGAVHTIKDGIVMENANLMREVEAMVRKSKEGVSPVNEVTRPFLRAP